MWAIVGTLGAAIFTALIGNALVQRWQQRNWFAQQRQLIHQRELDDLKILLEEVSSSINSRLFSMRILLLSLKRNSPEFEQKLSEYAEQVRIWNIKLQSFYNRISIFINRYLTDYLEDNVQKSFYKAGIGLERLSRQRRSGQSLDPTIINEVDEEMRYLTARIRDFSLGLTSSIEDRRSLIRDGKIIHYKEGDLSEYSTFNLIKIIFARDIDRIYIIRPA